MYHKIIFVGNLGKDPEMRYTAEGTPVTTFNVAVSEGSGDNKKVIWLRVSAWKKQAEACNQYLSKGSKVLVEGRLRPDTSGNPGTYQRKDGTYAASYEVTAETVRFLTPKSDEPELLEDDEVPF